jgi:hypothetical protein
VTAIDVLWAVGAYADEHDRPTPWEISHDEINRDIGNATRVLGELELAGARVLWCSMLAEAGQMWPYICGTFLARAQLSCADATAGEAARVAMFLRLMAYDAVFGVTEAILDGLDDRQEAYAEVFAGVRVLGAHPGAYERLQRGGLAPTRFVVCGPAVAIGRAPGGPAFAVADEWDLSLDGAGRVCVSARRPRAQQFVRTPTNVRGTIVDEGVIPCAS